MPAHHEPTRSKVGTRHATQKGHATRTLGEKYTLGEARRDHSTWGDILMGAMLTTEEGGGEDWQEGKEGPQEGRQRGTL